MSRKKRALAEAIEQARAERDRELDAFAAEVAHAREAWVRDVAARPAGTAAGGNPVVVRALATVDAFMSMAFDAWNKGIAACRAGDVEEGERLLARGHHFQQIGCGLLMKAGKALGCEAPAVMEATS